MDLDRPTIKSPVGLHADIYGWMGFEILKIDEVHISLSLSLSFSHSFSFSHSCYPSLPSSPIDGAFQGVSGGKIGGKRVRRLCVAFLLSRSVSVPIEEFGSFWEESQWLGG